LVVAAFDLSTIVADGAIEDSSASNLSTLADEDSLRSPSPEQS
jgi:hypothetical protein